MANEVKRALKLLLDSMAPSGDKTFWCYSFTRWGAASLMLFVITSHLGGGSWISHLCIFPLSICGWGKVAVHLVAAGAILLHLENCSPWNRSSETVIFLPKKGVKQGYISLPPSFPFPATVVAAFLQHDRREITHCSVDHDCLLFSKLGPQSKVTEAISWAPCWQPAVGQLHVQQEACRTARSHFAASSQDFCLPGDIQKRQRLCLSAPEAACM